MKVSLGFVTEVCSFISCFRLLKPQILKSKKSISPLKETLVFSDNNRYQYVFHTMFLLPLHTLHLPLPKLNNTNINCILVDFTIAFDFTFCYSNLFNSSKF